MMLGIFGAIMLVLLLGLIKLQVVDYADFAKQSEANSYRVQPLLPRRGLILDREKRPIVENRPSFTVSIVPKEKKPQTIPNLAPVIGLDTAEIARRLRRNLVSIYQPVPIIRDTSFAMVAILEERAPYFPGVSVKIEEVRDYKDYLKPECFTGHVGEISEQELPQHPNNKEYHPGSIIGKKGLEKEYDARLRGREGTAYIEVTATGQELGVYQGKGPTLPTAGEDLILTIDNDVQAAAVQALDSFCCGALVAIDPRSGDVLAMTSYPGFDANYFSSTMPESVWNAIATNPYHPLLNRPVNGVYPPGSTIKPVTIGAGLQEGVIDANTTLKPCYGGYQFGNRYWHCWQPRGHGYLTPTGAIEQSCDVYLYQVGQKLGVERLSHYLDLCGFGRVSGIDLPDESPGLDPTPEELDRRHGTGKWSNGLVLNFSIGQGELLVTPLQLAQFYCGLANNGVVMRPHLVQEFISPFGRKMIVRPAESFRLPFDATTIALLREGIRLVVEGAGGTARSLRNRDYSVGGKTGTAENPHGDNHSWFVGVAPMEAPEIVVAAIVENAGHGSAVAAPLVGKVIRAYMEKHGYVRRLAAVP